MFIRKADYYKICSTIQEQNNRIEDLEWIICKGEHDYKPIGEVTVAYDPFGANDLTRTVYRCTRCGKKE